MHMDILAPPLRCCSVSASASSSSSFSLFSSTRRRLKSPFKTRCSRGPPRRRDGVGNSDGNDKKGSSLRHLFWCMSESDVWISILITGYVFSSGSDSGGSSLDWDKAWSSFRKQGKKTLFSNFSPDKYVSWNPRRSEFPLSEEIDPIKRTERTNLMFWTSPQFQLTVAILIVTFLLLYTILSPAKWLVMMMIIHVCIFLRIQWLLYTSMLFLNKNIVAFNGLWNLYETTWLLYLKAWRE